MHPRICCILLITLFSFSCHDNDHAHDGLQAGISPALAGKLQGIYSGSFNKGIITVVLNYISGRIVSGYNIHKGLRRNINGTVAQDGGLLNLVLKEPGDNPFDGTFYFSIDTASLKIDGRWVPLDSTKLKTKQIALSRKAGGDRESYEDMDWIMASEHGRDSMLTFHNDGSCEFTFYNGPDDSTRQLITVRGSFERQVDTFKVEWQKNNYTPAQNMKLIKTMQKIKESEEEYEIPLLKGNGWELTHNMAG
jgi:hypothetical protein